MTRSTTPYFIVDAFTDRSFAGNPAAVVPLEEWKDDRWLQNVAMEMNLSDTAFLVAREDGLICAGLPQMRKSSCVATPLWRRR